MEMEILMTLYAVVDSSGRVYWTGGHKGWVPDKFRNNPRYKIITLKGEV